MSTYKNLEVALLTGYPTGRLPGNAIEIVWGWTQIEPNFVVIEATWKNAKKYLFVYNFEYDNMYHSFSN